MLAQHALWTTLNIALQVTQSVLPLAWLYVCKLMVDRLTDVDASHSGSEAMFAGLAALLGVAFAIAMLSALFPKAADLSSLGTKGNCNQLAGLVATFLIPAMLSPVAILVLAGQFLWGNLYAGVGLVAGWMVVAALLSFPLTHMAAALLTKRRENVSLVAQGS